MLRKYSTLKGSSGRLKVTSDRYIVCVIYVSYKNDTFVFCVLIDPIDLIDLIECFKTNIHILIKLAFIHPSLKPLSFGTIVCFID